MKKGTPTNMAASVRTRLLSFSKANREDFTYVLTRYALERLLARVERSAFRETFTLKGAMLFRVWSPTLHRPTKDLDLLGTGAPDTGRLEAIFRELCEVSLDPDGVTFDPKSVRAARIKEDAEYEGVRVNVTAHIGSARLELQVDIGFGDAVMPAIVEVEFPTLLGAPAPRLRAYPRESVVAEKVEAMEHLGIANRPAAPKVVEFSNHSDERRTVRVERRVRRFPRRRRRTGTSAGSIPTACSGRSA
ncbi:MAG TPA: nucleotidyl transferase AbiEii/AbiGii toxin family protein [Polyangiaceae bacterium]|nr:nucleotidyl transferase AbiEii/AbiGii toxin family protein [Polyangiaceae bacterium]